MKRMLKNLKSLAACVLALCLMAGSEARSQEANPEIPAVTTRMNGFVENGELPGAVTLLAQDGNIVHLSACGFADLQQQTPMTVDSLFSIASMTKPVAAAAVLMLVEEGKLSLDDPVAKYLTDFAKPTHDAITVRQLLSHTSGLMAISKTMGRWRRRLQ